MHPNFYHWHNRVELKPDPAILQARWDAAAKFAEHLSSDDTCSLLRMAFFGAATPDFGKRFSGALVVLEPTFLPVENAQLLQVMATAALYGQMETSSFVADAVALGSLAAAFQSDRVQPVCQELAQRATEYLAEESERVRPMPQVKGDYQALKKATAIEDWQENPEATLILGKAILELGATMGHISEENQFLWWLLGRRSSHLNKRREQLTPKEYALVAAAEAAERVTLLPPPASVESLIGEALTHCAKVANSAILLTDFVDAANIDHLKPLTEKAMVQELCPLATLLEVRRGGSKVDAASLVKVNIPKKLKLSPSDVANQYFRELMFLRAAAQIE